MLRKGSSCPSIASRKLSSTIEPIWITDDLLANAFHRFSHTSRRYGSNVPGPLEARKRASKRRNTYTAYNAGAPQQLDPPFLFGPPSLNGSRNTGVETEFRPAQSFLPSWLFSRPDNQIETELKQPNRVANLTSTFNETNEQSLNDALKGAGSVRELLDIFESRNLNTRKIPNLILSVYVGPTSKWTVDEMAKLLTDPSLSQQQNYIQMRFVHALSRLTPIIPSIFQISENWDILFRAICQAVELGLLDAPRLGYIISSLPDVAICRNGNMAEPLDIKTLNKQTFQLLASLHKCRVLGIEDIRFEQRKDSLSRVMHFGPSPPIVDLLRTLNWGPKTIAIVSQVDCIVQWLSEPGLQETFSSHMKDLRNFLLAVPRERMLHTLSGVTERLLHMKKDGKGDRRPLDAWGRLLDSLAVDAAVEANFMAPEALREMYQSFSKESSPAEKMVMTYWLMRGMFHGFGLSTTAQQDDPRLRQVLLDICRGDQPTSTLEWLSQAINTSKLLPLERVGSLMFNLARIMKEAIDTGNRTLSLPPSSEDGVLSLCSILWQDLFFKIAAKIFVADLIALCNKITNDLPWFVRTVKRVESESGGGFLLAKRVFKSSKAMNLGLQQTRLRRAEWRSVAVLEDVFVVKARPYEYVSVAAPNEESFADFQQSLPEPESFLDAVSHLAVYFATNKSVSASTSYHRVHWFLEYLLWHRVRVDPLITRSLWHAGVARAGPTGCTQKTLEWICIQVAKYEGPSVARMLVRDGGFRGHRLAALNRLLDRTGGPGAWRQYQIEDDDDLSNAEDDYGLAGADNSTQDTEEPLFSEPESTVAAEGDAAPQEDVGGEVYYAPFASRKADKVQWNAFVSSEESTEREELQSEPTTESDEASQTLFSCLSLQRSYRSK